MSARRVINIPVDATLVEQAGRFELSVARVVEEALATKISDVERNRIWRQENRAAIEATNRHIDEHGLWYLPDSKA